MPGWGYPPDQTVNMSKLAVDTLFWPLYEWENGTYKVNIKPREPKPLEDFLRPQARFSHLFKKGNEPLVEEFKAEITKQWERLLRREQASG